jgi:hypothetical protein
VNDTCQVCGDEIKMMVRKGTGICCNNCEKKKTPISKENS